MINTYPAVTQETVGHTCSIDSILYMPYNRVSSRSHTRVCRASGGVVMSPSTVDGTFGRIDKICNMEVYYRSDGRIDKIGNMEVYYRSDGRIDKIGNMEVYYRYAGSEARIDKVGNMEVYYRYTGGSEFRIDKIGTME